MESGQTGTIGKIVPSHVEVEAKLELEYVTTQSRHLGERSAEKTTAHCHISPECAMRMHAQVKNKLFFETLIKFNIFSYNVSITSYILIEPCEDLGSKSVTGLTKDCQLEKDNCDVLEDCKNTCACGMLCYITTDNNILHQL